jgi:hypothetical protein
MKKIVIGLVVVLILLIACSYIFIPNTINISSAIPVKTTQKNILSCINDTTIWQHWWPDSSKQSYNDYHFHLQEPYSDGAAITVSNENETLVTKILLIPINNDSLLVTWETSFPTSSNPFTRINRYMEARSIKKSFDQLLKSVADFSSQTKNIYGFTIQRTTFRHTVLLATRSYSTIYPSIDMIYKKIDTMRTYMSSQFAKESDPPMINVQPADSNRYEYMIAIPIDKKIESGPNMFISLMVPMEGRFLETQVQGGPVTIQHAHHAVASFMEDRMLTPPAIPFEMMVTDRRSETDTSKWMTKIFYPTMWN